MKIPWKHHWPDAPEDVAIDVMPASNGEYVPKEPSANQLAIMALQNDKIEETRRRFNMSRRHFVRTSAAYGIGVWAIDQVTAGRWGRFAFADGTATTRACDLENPGSQLANLPGEFVLDTQGHALDSAGRWRVENPGFEVFLRQWTSQAMGDYAGVNQDGPRGFGAGELDWVENLGQYHYLKETFLDSSTTVSLLTALPNLPDAANITPIKFAAQTRDLINTLSGGTERCFVHAFSQPNRGFMGPDTTPTHQAEDFAWMEQAGSQFDVRGWKLYCGWGDPSPNQNGWWFDDDNGIAIVEHIRRIQAKTNRPSVVCTHKGLAFNGTFDSAKFAPRDMGVIARLYPDITFFTYHCAYDGELMLPYAGDANVNSSNRSVDSFIKSLRENGVDATRKTGKLSHGNTDNMYAELGSVWWNVMHDANQAAHLLGKLITFVGPRRIVYGTDCIWYGNPQPQIVMMRAFQFSNEAKAFYNLPFGLEGDRFDPTRNAMDGNSYLAPHPDADSKWPTDGVPHPERTIRNGILGRNAADAYGLDPDAVRGQMSCDDVQKLRDGYVLNPMTPKETAPMKTNRVMGPRTPREFWRMVKAPDYSP